MVFIIIEKVNESSTGAHKKSDGKCFCILRNYPLCIVLDG